MFQPKRVKYRKTHRGRRAGRAITGNQVDFGDYALKATAVSWVTARQIEAGRRAITRQSLDPNIPRQANNQQASRNKDGKR